MPKSVFFISTGRCGTQWIYHTLKELYDKSIEVRHELLPKAYRSAYFLDNYFTCGQVEVSRDIYSHLELIKNTIPNKHYLEVGWPVYGLIPAYINDLNNENVQLIHIIRNPVDCALSMDKHKYYNNRERMIPRLLYPNNKSLIQKNINNKVWDSLNHFEKCLFFWTEINFLPSRLQQEFNDVKQYKLSFSGLFTDENIFNGLVDFIGLERKDVNPYLTKVKDAYVRPVTNPLENTKHIKVSSQFLSLINTLEFGHLMDQYSFKESY